MDKNIYENEKILIDVVRDRFSSTEISKLGQCIKDIGKNNSNRNIIWKDDSTQINEKIIISIQNGILSIEELKKLAQCLRDIEQDKPSRHLNIFMDCPDKTIEEMQDINNSISPGFPFKCTIKFDKANKK